MTPDQFFSAVANFMFLGIFGAFPVFAAGVAIRRRMKGRQK